MTNLGAITTDTDLGTPPFPATSGAWDHVETQELLAAVTVLTFSGLDGDTDELYRIHGMLDVSGILNLEINGATTNLTGTSLRSDPATNPPTIEGARETSARITESVTSAVLIDMIVWAASGVDRYVDCHCVYNRGAGTFPDVNKVGLHYADNSTNITSIGIRTSTASGLAIGSKMSIYKLVTS